MIKKLLVLGTFTCLSFQKAEACIVLPSPIAGTPLCATATEIGICAQDGRIGIEEAFSRDGLFEIGEDVYAIARTQDEITPRIQTNNPLGVQPVRAYSLTVIDLKKPDQALKLTQMVDGNAPQLRVLNNEEFEYPEEGLQIGRSYKQGSCAFDEVE